MANASTCARSWQAVSNGVFQGNMPLDYALPLLILQVTLVLLATRTLGLLFKPLRQPRVLAEIIGGVLLGPTALGRNKRYMKMIFPEDSMTLLDTMANIGLLFFLFMVGLEVDLKEIKKSGKSALSMALAGIAIPFVATLGVAKLVQQHLLPANTNTRLAPLVVFMGVPLSITAFPVLVRIMAERKLLKTELGRLVLPAAAINDIIAWVLLALGVALSGPAHNTLTPVLVLLSGVAFGVFMLIVVRRLMTWVVRQRNQESISEICVTVTLLSVLLCGLITDAIGIHPLFGAFIFGLIIPKEGTFAETIIQKMEDFVTILLIPLFFASSGLKTNLATINSASSVAFLLLFLITAAFGKIIGTVVVARLTGQSDYRKNLSLGFLMNTKGLAELIVLNIGKDLKILNDQVFAILVLMCLLTTFMTTPMVMALYKPARTPSPYKHRKLPKLPKNGQDDYQQLRIMACLHGTHNIPAIIALMQACSAGPKQQLLKRSGPALKLFAAHLMELSDRPSAMLLASRTTSNRGLNSSTDPVFVAFETFAQLSRAAVRTLTVMSQATDMHQDICAAAQEKRVNMLLLPFHKSLRRERDRERESEKQDEIELVLRFELTGVNQKVLKHAPCSVAVLVDHGSFGESPVDDQHSSRFRNIAVLFRGGPDDCEALAFGAHLAQESTIALSLIRLLPPDHERLLVLNPEEERDSDKEAIELCRSSPGRYNYEEVITNDPVEAAEAIAKSGRFCLLLVGLSRGPSNLVESPELGPIGDALVALSTSYKSPLQFPSLLVVQQYNPSHLSFANVA